MSEATIPVDLRNPGQVFACLGLAEAAETILRTPCESHFGYTGSETTTTFTLRVDAANDPVRETIKFLRDASVATLIPTPAARGRAMLSTKKWEVTDVAADASISSGPVRTAPASLPALLEGEGTRFVLDHWADGSHSGRDNVKFWAGSGGYPGSALARDALALVAAIPTDRIEETARDPFRFSCSMSSSFRFDWRRDYIPLDAGFSPNCHGDVTMVGYPLTEILAVVGLQYARPSRTDRRDKLRYRYGVSRATLPNNLARVVLGAVDIGFPMRTFHMQLGWPGKVNQARCIIDAREELPS